MDGTIEPVSRAYVTVAGTRYELVPTAKLTWPETKVTKELSGMPLGEMEAALAQADPDAWFAYLFVSIRRVDPRITPQKLTAMIGDSPLVAVIETVERDDPEVDAKVPPGQERPDAPQSSSLSSNGSGGLTLPRSTLETSGSPI